MSDQEHALKLADAMLNGAVKDNVIRVNTALGLLLRAAYTPTSVQSTADAESDSDRTEKEGAALSAYCRDRGLLTGTYVGAEQLMYMLRTAVLPSMVKVMGYTFLDGEGNAIPSNQNTDSSGVLNEHTHSFTTAEDPVDNGLRMVDEAVAWSKAQNVSVGYVMSTATVLAQEVRRLRQKERNRYGMMPDSVAAEELVDVALHEFQEMEGLGVTQVETLERELHAKLLTVLRKYGKTEHTWQIVDTDNFGGDYPNEKVVIGDLDSEGVAKRVCDYLTGRYYRDENCPRFLKVTRSDYVLQPGFEP